MTKDISLWREKFKITHSLVAPDGLASIHGLAYCMQETAVNHSDAANMGYNELIREHKAWVLTRQLIKLFKMPVLDQKITIETWAHGTTETMAIRDFNILNAEQEILGISRTSWMMLDLVARRPVRLSRNLHKKIPLVPGRLMEDLILEKIIVDLDTPSSERTYQVVFSDLDMNHHVNNINYLKWVLDDFDGPFRDKYRIRTIEMNYLAEAFLGDKLINHTFHVGEDEFLTKITNPESSKPILTSKSKWVPKE
jgi:acyl-ACP thioesterase